MSSSVLERLARAAAPRIEPVEINGETFFVRGMGAAERAIFIQCVHEATLARSAVPDNTVAALGLCNEDGSPISDDRQVVLDTIRALDGRAIYRLAQKTLDLSGFGAKAVEAAEKN